MENLMKCVPCKLKESEFCAECTSKTQDAVKTMAEWNVNGVDFTKYVEDYDEIDEELYNYFMDVLPPMSLRTTQGFVDCGFQCSEPYDIVYDNEGNGHNTYSTFGKKNGKYYYMGLNVKGQVFTKIKRSAA